MLKRSYLERVAFHQNPTARRLLEIMDRKKTNLAVSADVRTKQELLDIADGTGHYICVLKTHIDTINDFDQDLVKKLSELAERHDFLIFEDRKFADIGNTVKHQYADGIYKISSWAHITNAHPVPGSGIVSGLKEIGLPLSRGLLILAEMSASGNLARGSYTIDAVRIARKHRDFVFGYIGMRRMPLYSGDVGESDAAVVEEKDEDYITLTPGVSLEASGDALGQVYRTPRQVILESGCDVIIVGRGIYGKGGKEEMKIKAKEYRDAGWAAYLERIGS
ncbi:Orotidine 5'-phosphate decarboxylase domain-containing protein [Cladochytrium replicatum]|nr:Orotidine 5'-phosphate decarboxylase domain-containing protein [Cladochytrium replicatum]